VIRIGNKNERIWVWLHGSELYKAVYRSVDSTFVVFNEYDEIIFTYTCVSAKQLQEIETLLTRIGAKQLDKCAEPFTYL